MSLLGSGIRLPSVRVAVTETCNLRCQYCPADGDSVQMQRARLSTAEFTRLLAVASSVGFSQYSLTGGEPLGTPRDATTTFELARLLNDANAADPHGWVKLNTNGAFLLRYRHEVLQAGFSELKISLDTLDPATFKWLAKRGQKVFDDTLAGILSLAGLVPIRLQMVVGKYNVGELPAMLDFCEQHGFGIKLFDISRYDNALAGSGAFCDDNYVPLATIVEWLGERYGQEPNLVTPPGGFGHRMAEFTMPSGSKVRVRDTSKSATYSSELCETCPHYMCQDGLCTLVIAADGHVRFCREGEQEQTIATRAADGQLMSDQDLQDAFVCAVRIFDRSERKNRTIEPMRRLLPLTVISATPPTSI